MCESTLFGEVLALESTKCYLRKQGIVVRDDTNKSAALGTFQKKMNRNRASQSLFGFPAPNGIKLYVMMKVTLSNNKSQK